MSRVGKAPITIPSGVEVKLESGLVTVKGPKGTLSTKLHPAVKLEKQDNILVTTVSETEKNGPALWGLTRALVNNMVVGVTQGFQKQLEINGIGFKAEVKGREIVLSLGFSHPVSFSLPAGIEAKVEKNLLTISGFDKQLVGEVAAQIRRLKKPEPYKGKGIKYLDEVIHKKAGKALKGATAK